MTWTLDNSGTQTAVISTEHVLVSANTNNGTFVFAVRCNNMVNSDILELRVYTMTLTAGTLEQCWKGTFCNIQTNVVKLSPPIASDQSIKVTLKQTAGTGRAYDWKLLRV